MSEKAEKGNGGIRLKQKLKKELQMLYQPPDPVLKTGVFAEDARKQNE